MRKAIRAIVQSIPESSAQKLRFNFPKENSSLEEYLLARYSDCALTRSLGKAKHAIKRESRSYDWNAEDQDLNRNLENFLFKLEQELFRSKTEIRDRRLIRIASLCTIIYPLIQLF